MRTMINALSYFDNSIVGRYRTVERNIKSKSNSFYDSFLDLLENTIKRILMLENVAYDEKYTCGTLLREESIEKYSDYFDVMYEGNIEFKAIVDEIYSKYKKGETIYLECCCKPLPCHGDIIAKKLQKMLIREKLREYRKEKNNG